MMAYSDRGGLGRALLLVVCMMVARADADGGFQLSGTAGVYAKYNTNLELVDAEDTGIERKETFISEPTADLRLARSWGEDWWLDLAYTGHANLHAEHDEENWYFNRTNISLLRRLGDNAVNLTSEFRHYTVPEDNDFDFARHTGILSYKRTLSPLWQVRMGFQNIITRYPETSSLNYTVNGAFVEARNTWSFDLSSYYSYDLQLYEGSADPQEFANTSPEDGSRHTLRAGFDWLVSPRHVLSGTYMYQIDSSYSDYGLDQIGTEGSEESQDNQAEFDLKKHKATLLYSLRFSERTTFSIYEEVIRKAWEDEEEASILRDARNDLLFLSSAFVKYKWTDRVQFKFRYLFRINESSFNDYTDHIVFLGPELRF